MKKWRFWAVMALVSAVNGAVFFCMTHRLMKIGIPDVDDQAALLFVPLLWMAAIGVLVVLNTGTLLYGWLHIASGAELHPVVCFCTAANSKREKFGRTAFEVFACSMMAMAWLLFSGEGTWLWAAAYSLTGGALPALLYSWHKAGGSTINAK